MSVLPMPVSMSSLGDVRTTVEIPDALLDRAREKARSSGRSVRDLIEEGLRLVLAAGSARCAYRLPDRSVGKPGGLNPLEARSWQELRGLVYSGR